MKNKIFIYSFIIIIVAVICVAGYFYLSNLSPSSQTVLNEQDYKNATYQIEGTSVTLINGYSEKETAPGSESKIVTQYFGNEKRGNLNGDNFGDVVFLLTQSSGGSGTFYYVVACLGRKEGGCIGTSGFLLGDRIAPQTTEINNQEIVINYADRNSGEPMTTLPSVGVSKYLYISNGILVEKQIACTEEAKLCPDGSGVGRTGANCEFPECPNVVFGNVVSLNIGQEAIFTDGLSVKLLTINDSRCKPGVVCVWEGELSADIVVVDNNGGRTIRLSSSTQKETSDVDYSYKLQSITESNVNLVIFKKTGPSATSCFVGGCSSEICSNNPSIVSPCIWKEEFACYKTAECKRQVSGQCGWTQTQELTKCLQEN